MKCVKRGFTLVELLVVVSIIAVLLAILIPSMQKARYQTQKVVCIRNMQQQIYVFFVYAQDFSGKFPKHDARLPMRVKDTGYSSDFNPWSALKNKYMINSQILICPITRVFGGMYANTKDASPPSGGRSWGGWDGVEPGTKKPVDVISIAYAWHANYTPTLSKNEKPRAITFYDGEAAWPMSYTQCKSLSVFVTHPYFDNDWGLYDFTHGGALQKANIKIKDSKSIDVPIGYSDGRVRVTSKSSPKKRASYLGDRGVNNIYY